MAVWEMPVREPSCTGNGVTEVGAPHLFLTSFTFPSFKGSMLRTYLLLVEQREF